MNERIKNGDELEFAIFCIENLAVRLKTDAERIYTALAESSSFLYDYIVAHYEVLHTQDKEYIINNILEAMAQCGINNPDAERRGMNSSARININLQFP